MQIIQVICVIYRLQSNLNNSNTDGSFTMVHSNSFLSPYEILPIAQEKKKKKKKKKNREISLFYLCVLIRFAILMSELNIQFLLKKKKKKIDQIFLNYRNSLPDLVAWLTLCGSNYPYLDQISMVPKMFEPLKCNCISWAFGQTGLSK